MTPPYSDEEESYLGETRNYSAGNNALLRQLVDDVREIRRIQTKQGDAIGDLQVSMGKVETQVLALQSSGRAEAYVGNREIRQAFWVAVVLIVSLAVMLWILRP